MRQVGSAMSDDSKVKLAAVQAAPVYLDLERTVDKARELIQEAGSQGADIVGFPESFIPGHPVWYYFQKALSPTSRTLAKQLFDNAVTVPGPATDALCQAAADAGVYVVIGIAEKQAGSTGTIYNSQLFIDQRGEIVGKHQKLVPTLTERLVHAPGSGQTLRCAPSPYGPISGMLCGENSNPLALATLASEYPRVHVASWPHHFLPNDPNAMPGISLLVSRSIAYVTKSFVISVCGTIGPEMIELVAENDEDREWLQQGEHAGGSCIIGPSGHVLAGPLEGNAEDILDADVDLDASVGAKFVHDVAGHYNRPDVFSLRVRRDPAPLFDADDGKPGSALPASRSRQEGKEEEIEIPPQPSAVRQ